MARNLHGLNKPQGFEEMMQYIASLDPNLKAKDKEGQQRAAADFMMNIGEPEKLQEIMAGFEKKYPAAAMAMKESSKEPEVAGKESTVKALPMEDTIWCIGDLHDSDDEEPDEPPKANEAGEIVRTITVIDGDGSKTDGGIIYTSSMYNVSTPIEQHLYNVVMKACLKPMLGSPRRPRYIMMRNKGEAKDVKLDLSALGIVYIDKDDNYSCDPSKQSVALRECLVCHKGADIELLRKCSMCKSVLYCGRNCQKKDWVHKNDVHGHKNWCNRMKEFTAKTEELTKLPFTFAKATTDLNFSYDHYKRFLEAQGVYSQGLWRRESMKWYKGAKLPDFGDLEPCEYPVVLPAEAATLESAPEQPLSVRTPVTDWEGYYKYRGFRLDSPIAILLHWPLTLYYILTTCLPNDFPQADQVIDQPSTFVIHMLGVEKEVEMMSIFKELMYLIQGVHFEIHMIGPDISQAADGRSYDDTRLHIMAHKCVYHEYPGSPPDLVIGFNAGIAAYVPWAKTLVTLREIGVPTYFTDYCQYSSECADPPMDQLGLGVATKPIVNPFRCPVRKFCEEQLMPWYSNGFIYHLEYVEVAN